MLEYGLYNSENEHDACGVGFVANINGQQSHLIIEKGIEVLKNLLHRGGIGGDNTTGDGAGILLQIPDIFFREACSKIGIELPEKGPYGVGMYFLPHDRVSKAECTAITKQVAASEGATVLGWRDVPVDANTIEGQARKEMPFIRQCFIGCKNLSSDAIERKLYVIRKVIERKVREEGIEDFYIPSFSSKTIVYKGLLLGNQLPSFYEDLRDPKFVSGLAVIHQRYSTNTFPSWKLAQPFRYLAHNGEINTLRGNLNHMKSRESLLASRLFGADIKKLIPVIDNTGSDSSCLDNALELLVSAGRDIPHAMMMLVPQAWGLKYPIGPDLRGFFEYHSGLMEPWDGPAALAFTDGTRVGALLDRNGLRPARYTVLDDGFIVLASETGVLDFDSSRVVEKGALRPGQIIIVDLEKKRFLRDGEIKTVYAHNQPYRRWVDENKIVLHGLFNDVSPVNPDINKLIFRQKLFGYTREDLSMIIGPMASGGHEPVGSMGCDTPLAVLSEQPQLLFSYFKQMFAQVTNPPIDSIREELVMSLMTFMGNSGNILTTLPQHSHLIKLRHPVLSNEDLESIRALNIKNFGTTTLQIGFSALEKIGTLEKALEHLCDTAEMAIEKQKSLIILSDRNLPDHMVPIPSLLAVSAVNQRLSRKGARTGASIVIETGEAREVHHMALLLGYGATAINPYMAFETVADMAIRKVLDCDLSVAKALENYISALCKGLMKIMSKMGISTLRSYRNAQVFEVIGLSNDIIEKYFTGTASRIGGIGLEGIASEAMTHYAAAYDKLPGTSSLLPSGGQYKFRKDGERHLWTPESISKLQLATRRNDTALYKEYARLINDQTKKQNTLRGLFRIKKAAAVPIDEVESAAEIMKRFVTSAMSFGSISKEAHETLAIAMNRIGAMSNSGEGGEDPERYKPLMNGDNLCSAIKQVASGRFGVTIEYLVNAREIQIKIAQGAKPGEGGQLPGHKVNGEIAKVRHSTPGVTLISPPPHHDIYSIEDIKQLIFDLKNANPNARISVKLVSEVGVGTIAAGVAKGCADMILISGYDGGTGASPLSSIKHAGAPWELGLAETQQTLVLNKLRSRVRIQADGQMKTGRDVIIAALLGAEEFGFATAPLVVCGCVMMRKCHQNTCPVGVATQDPELRKRYTGRPEYVINFFRMIAEEVREYMASTGFRKLDDLIGRSDLLEINNAVDFWKARGLDFSRIFNRPGIKDPSPVRCIEKQNHEIDDVLDKQLIKDAAKAIKFGKTVEIVSPIRNVNRATGTMLSGEIAKRYGSTGLPDDAIVCRFKGAAGQSFGAFGIKGITFILEGESNDYLGKGLSGAKIIVKPFSANKFNPSENVICGNVLLYGATSGDVYIYGRAGERFAIRNSGVNAVVEGVGDHGCEYMTGGRVAILGETGVNFAAGMSGGIAYVYDPDRKFDGRCNLDMVDLELVEIKTDIEELKGMIKKHFEYTGSKKSEFILSQWESEVHSFVKVFPMEYRRALGFMSRENDATKIEEVVDG
ncbi:MAG: glutamate synthase large subunit [Kiritimatiellae bacterium]|nr:glutamate synthase large subunit [Kiritimatiellia bacterium]MDD5519437.1 glutamate synthase large subunit [Kiritimatiellia bacterium]